MLLAVSKNSRLLSNCLLKTRVKISGFQGTEIRSHGSGSRIQGVSQRVFFSEISQIKRPKHVLQLANIVGAIHHLKTGKGKDGDYVDITFTDDALAEFEGSPLKATTGEKALAKIANTLNASLQDYVLNLVSNGLSFVASTKLSSAKAIDAHTLRVGLVGGSDLKAIHDFEENMKGHRHPKATALFANYSALPKSANAQVPPKKREAYFIVARKGMEIKKGKMGPVRHVVFKDVERVIVVSDTAVQKEYKDGELVKIIGTGEHPFKPNGMFALPSKEGLQHIVLSFDKAQLNPKTRDITFEVSFLETAESKHSVAMPVQFIEEKSFETHEPVTVFLDFHGGGRGL